MRVKQHVKLKKGYVLGARGSKKSRTIRSVRNVFISAFVLLLIVFGVGAAYIWYIGQHSVVDTNVIVNPVKDTPNITTPTKPAANAQESAAVRMLESPVVPGENSSITVKTNAGSRCTITVLYNQIASKDSGLIPKTADEYGIVDWSWTVDSSVPLGKWPVTVTCVYNNRSAVVVGDLEVVAEVNQ